MSDLIDVVPFEVCLSQRPAQYVCSEENVSLYWRLHCDTQCSSKVLI